MGADDQLTLDIHLQYIPVISEETLNLRVVNRLLADYLKLTF